MSVKPCCRTNCENDECEFRLLGRYVCRSCIRELLDRGRRWDMTGDEPYDDLDLIEKIEKPVAEFLDSDAHDIDTDAGAEDTFDAMVGMIRDGYQPSARGDVVIRDVIRFSERSVSRTRSELEKDTLNRRKISQTATC